MDAAISAFAGLLEKFGWPGALLIVLGLLAWRVCSFLAVKLFNEAQDATGHSIGYVPRVVDAHIDMVEAVKKTAEDNTEILRANEGTNREILVLVRQGKEEMIVLNKAINEMARARIAHTEADSGILRRGRDKSGPSTPDGIGVV